MDLWSEEPALVQNLGPANGMAPVKEVLYEMLRTGLQHRDKVFRITMFTFAFRLLD